MKENVSQTVQAIIIFSFIGFFIIYLFVLFFAKAHKKKIYVLKKRQTYHQGLDNTQSKSVVHTHYTIDCKYEGTDKIHTLNCPYDIYNYIKEGETYFVTVKLFDIISINRR